jgi:hypothetical protein
MSSSDALPYFSKDATADCMASMASPVTSASPGAAPSRRAKSLRFQNPHRSTSYPGSPVYSSPPPKDLLRSSSRSSCFWTRHLRSMIGLAWISHSLATVTRLLLEAVASAGRFSSRPWRSCQTARVCPPMMPALEIRAANELILSHSSREYVSGSPSTVSNVGSSIRCQLTRAMKVNKVAIARTDPIISKDATQGVEAFEGPFLDIQIQQNLDKKLLTLMSMWHTFGPKRRPRRRTSSVYTLGRRKHTLDSQYISF